MKRSPPRGVSECFGAPALLVISWTMAFSSAMSIYLKLTLPLLGCWRGQDYWWVVMMVSVQCWWPFFGSAIPLGSGGRSGGMLVIFGISWVSTVGQAWCVVAEPAWVGFHGKGFTPVRHCGREWESGVARGVFYGFLICRVSLGHVCIVRWLKD